MNFKIYHVYTGKSQVETDVIRAVQPPRLMLSYHYFKNKTIAEIREKLGYEFDYLYDSGAYSAWSQGFELQLQNYIDKIKQEGLTNYINLDIFGDNAASYTNFLAMREQGLDPIPVVHFENEDDYLQKYLDHGCQTVAIGGTVPMRNKSDVANYVRMFTWLYPDIHFHLLGSTSAKIINTCNISSCDSSSWIMRAVFGEPKWIPGHTAEAKAKRAYHNLKLEVQLEKAQHKTQ